jgi:hypothetical protein
MSEKLLFRERYGEAFWRAHHEAWRHSEFCVSAGKAAREDLAITPAASACASGIKSAND